MIYCNLKGGLGNMLFQIAATMEFSRKLGVDYSFPNLLEHLEYAATETNYNPKLKSVAHYQQLFKDLRTVKPILTFEKIVFPFHYVDYQLPKDCIIEGFFQSEKYFKESRRQILSLFPKKQKINKVAVHIRRGDYLKNQAYHNVLSIEYYLEAFKLFPNNFLLFSDDIEWCKSIFTGMEFEFYEGENDLEEMLTMSCCEHNIIANSSFSWWGAWLNTNEHKKVVCPSQWVGPQLKHLNTSDICCDEWIKI